MATTFPDDVPIRRWSRRATASGATGPMVSDRAFHLLSIVMCMFMIRDMLTSSLRYYLAQVHLGAVWLVPDMLAFVSLGYFAWQIGLRHRSPFAILLVISFAFSLVVGMIFMSADGFAAFSAAKMFMPLFIGLSFPGRSACDLKPMRVVLTIVFVASTIGLLVEPYVAYPWLGQAVDNFGQTKDVGRVWWAGDGNIRYGGLAGESTMASYMVIIPYFMVHRHFPRIVNVLLWIPMISAVQLSTSKTALGLMILFTIYYVINNFIYPMSMKGKRRMARWSFITVPMVVLMMLILGGIDLTTIDPKLFSMQDRINNTWGFPFFWMSENFPLGLIIGCGMGCFTYPMQYTALANLWVPVDNFYMATIAMMGLPFVVFIFGMFSAPGKCRFNDKLLLMTAINIYSVTVQGYGPSTCAVLLGYAFSDMFLPRQADWSRKRSGKDGPAGAAEAAG